MKIRQGFVSNSSSSSFVIGCKGKLTKDKILKTMNIAEDSIFYRLAKDLSEAMVSLSNKMTKEEYMEERYVDDLDEAEEGVKEILTKGLTLYVGDAASDGEYEEALLCNLELNYNSEDLIIKKEAGY